MRRVVIVMAGRTSPERAANEGEPLLDPLPGLGVTFAPIPCLTCVAVDRRSGIEMTNTRARLAVLGAALLLSGLAPAVSRAASSKGCDGGAFAIVLGDGTTLRGDQRTVVAAGRLGAKLQVRRAGPSRTPPSSPTTGDSR
jgi:hypothetical protein